MAGFGASTLFGTVLLLSAALASRLSCSSSGFLWHPWVTAYHFVNPNEERKLSFSLELPAQTWTWFSVPVPVILQFDQGSRIVSLTKPGSHATPEAGLRSCLDELHLLRAGREKISKKVWGRQKITGKLLSLDFWFLSWCYFLFYYY